MSTKCIICYTDLTQTQWSPTKPPDILTASSLSSSTLRPDPEAVPGTDLQGQVQQKDLLSKHLDIIFILRNIFEVPLNQLSFYLRHCPSIENWITTCGKCEELVQDYGVIYRKGQDARRRLIKIVKETYDKDRGDVGRVALDITDKCRHFINEYNYDVITNPFIEGDSRARDLLKSGEARNQDHLEKTIEVKEELPELLQQSENNLEHLNEFVVDALNIPTTVNDSSPLNLYHDDDDDNDHWNEDVEMLEENEDLSLISVQQPVVEPKVPQPQLPIVPTKPIRKNMPRVAKRIAKTKTQNLLRKLDKSLIPPKPTRVKRKPPKKPKRKTFLSHKKVRSKKYFPVEEEPVPEPEPVDQEECSPEPPPSPKIIFRDDSEDDDNIKEYKDDDFEISDIDEAEESSDFEISEDEEKPKKYKKRTKSSTPKPIRKFKCSEAECSALEFDTRKELNAHRVEIHNILPKPSVIGQRKYPDECYDYSENRKRKFRVQIPSKCKLCLKTFKNQDSLRGHMRVMDELRWPHHCKICGKGDTSKASLEKHEALCQTGEALLNLITCPAEGCGLILNSTVMLETHYRHHHRDLETQPCTIANCSEKFFTKVGLEIHLTEKHKEDKPFNCDHCNQGFPSKTKLVEHRKRALEREAVEKDPSLAKICKHCGKTFVNEVGLRCHVNRAHENKFEYFCEHCGKGDSNQEKMNIHLWKKHGRRDVTLKYMCEVEGCGRICTGKGQFEAHKARHAGIPQFCCEECGKEFYEAHHLREHVKAMHESKKGEKVKCDICGLEFGYWKYMIRHKRTVHENKKRRPKNKPKTESSGMKEEQNGAGVGKEEVFMAAGQQFNLQM